MGAGAAPSMSADAQQGLLAAAEAETKHTAIMQEMDQKLVAKQKRRALEQQALDDMQSEMSPRGRIASYRPSRTFESGIGSDTNKKKRSTPAKWFSCFKTPRSALSHPPELKNTSCTKEHGTTKRLRRFWK